MELKERVEDNVDVDWRIIFSGNIWKLKGKGTGFTTHIHPLNDLEGKYVLHVCLI